jgi:hypothetical protein
VAIVNGLWGPWKDPDDAIDDMYANLRAIIADASAIAPAPASGLDPRARHGYGVSVSPGFVQRFWGAISCPVLAVETPTSITPPGERGARAAMFGGETTLVELDDTSPAATLAAVLDWMPTAIV